jgi:hypothetical protein
LDGDVEQHVWTAFQVNWIKHLIATILLDLITAENIDLGPSSNQTQSKIILLVISDKLESEESRTIRGHIGLVRLVPEVNSDPMWGESSRLW